MLPGAVLVDVGFAVFSGVDGATTAATAGGPVDAGGGLLRGPWVMGADGVQYAFIANFGSAPAEVGGGRGRGTLCGGRGAAIYPVSWLLIGDL
ncbi:MAG: hypothetical protein KJZ86_16000 [Caldilineaceae bacterium]|nr:hypothetical protein [Caldilineaceae bacterium]HRJ41704.1 hypothetical protein [Caldilineaceae bacterium]